MQSIPLYKHQVLSLRVVKNKRILLFKDDFFLSIALFFFLHSSFFFQLHTRSFFRERERDYVKGRAGGALRRDMLHHLMTIETKESERDKKKEQNAMVIAGRVGGDFCIFLGRKWTCSSVSKRHARDTKVHTETKR